MPPSALISTSRQSSISVAVRVRPFTLQEAQNVVEVPETPVFCGDGGFSSMDTRGSSTERKNNRRHTPLGLRKIVEVVDDRMLIFDPPKSNPLAAMQRRAFPNGQLRGRIRDHRFGFDHVFDETATQQEVFAQTTRPLLGSVLDGYNATVFAYGATGCGKTHTISGTPQDPGLIFLTMAELYRMIASAEDTRTVTVTVSFLEIYNETIRDLLAPETPAKSLVLREDSARRIVVANLSTHTPQDVGEIMDLLATGNRNRTSSPTEANATSSRSHAVLQINVTSRPRTASLAQEHTYATLSVIDLAGSERAAATRNRGVRLNEGANINKSLLALGNCINALCEPGQRGHHVPYRDSKLTRLLKFSLGGNCKTVMIVCVSPSSQHYDETLNTLKYANRAKEIKTKVSRNRHSLDRHVGSYLKMITEQKLEIDELRAREAHVLESHAAKIDANNAACCSAIIDAVANIRAAVSKPRHDHWRKCFSLAKRKFLLLHLHELDRIVQHIQQLVEPETSVPVSPTVRRLLVQAEQLQRKFNGQLVALEHFYESASESDALLANSTAHALKQCRELEGWSESHTQLFHQLAAHIGTHVQNDLLVSSSVLFDYLAGESGQFSYLSHAFRRTVDAAQLSLTGAAACPDADEILDYVSTLLERMNASDYDLALEDATAKFISSRTNVQASGPSSPRLRDKRASTSPHENSPATKRSMRVGSGIPQPSSVPEESDVSMDDSSFLHRSVLEQDSPLANHVNQNMLDFDALYDTQSMLDSPPMKRKSFGGLTGSKPDSDTDFSPPSKHSLLNKQASTKVVTDKPIPTHTLPEHSSEHSSSPP